MNPCRALLPNCHPRVTAIRCRCSATLAGCPGVAHACYHRSEHPGFVLLVLISLAQPLCAEGVGGCTRQWDAGSAVSRLLFLFPCDAKQINKVLMSSQDRWWEGCCRFGEVSVCHPVFGQGACGDAPFVTENRSSLSSASLQLWAA